MTLGECPSRDRTGHCQDDQTTRTNHKTTTAQPSEPILFPKLRIYFADFPYLHSAI